MLQRSSAGRKILHVDMDAFFVSVEQTLDPSLKGKPVVVGGDPKGRGVVAAASYEARRYGVHSAMPLSAALRLCPHAVFLRGSHQRYAEFSGRIFALLRKYTPLVEPMSLDEAFLDLAGCELLHGPAVDTAERIHDDIRRTAGINASIGMASNKLVAKVASDCAKPNGMLWIAAGRERAFLAPLPAGRLPGVGPKTGKRLRRMGVETVGDLAALPRERLEETFGQWGLDLYCKARGICDSPVEPESGPARSISRETTLDKDSSDPRFLLSALSYLAEKAAAQLRQSGLRAACVTVKVRYSDFSAVSRSRALSASACEDSVLRKTAAELFRGLFARRSRVRLVGVAFSSLTPPGPVQTSLFDTGEPERRDRLCREIDRIRGKYGFRAILRGTSRTFSASD
ncbi:MAG: DNA polymerase IV [Nitrospinae bacterium]|nr:DNA polymerase IV [Nitrospinota bacterium]